MKINGNGFLSTEGQAEAQKLLERLRPYVNLVERAISLCHGGLECAEITDQVSDIKKQKLIACIVLARLLEISESMVMLAKGGFSVDVTASFRNFLEAYFIFGNVCKSPDFVPKFFNTDLKAREKLINVANKHKTELFELVNEYATDEVRVGLKEHIASSCASESNCWEYAANIECTEIYDSMYRIASAATHSTPRSLAAYVTEDGDGQIVELHRHPQLDSIPERMIDLGGFLLNVRIAFNELFGTNSSEEITELREAFSTVIIAENGGRL